MINTIKPGTKKMWSLIKGSNEIVYDRTRKRLHLITGDCLIEVTAWAGLAVSFIVY
jgi:hypothetical protein